MVQGRKQGVVMNIRSEEGREHVRERYRAQGSGSRERGWLENPTLGRRWGQIGAERDTRTSLLLKLNRAEGVGGMWVPPGIVPC